MPVRGKDLLSPLQSDGYVSGNLGVLFAIRNREADFVVNKTLDDIFLTGAHNLSIDLGVVGLRPQVLGISRVAPFSKEMR